MNVCTYGGPQAGNLFNSNNVSRRKFLNKAENSAHVTPIHSTELLSYLLVEPSYKLVVCSYKPSLFVVVW